MAGLYVVKGTHTPLIREGKSLKSEKVGKLKPGDEIVVLEKQGNRLRIERGWISLVVDGEALVEQVPEKKAEPNLNLEPKATPEEKFACNVYYWKGATVSKTVGCRTVSDGIECVGAFEHGGEYDAASCSISEPFRFDICKVGIEFACGVDISKDYPFTITNKALLQALDGFTTVPAW
eukprot:TRINITY_DN8643_c0_g1_i1.p1 TRINITY_DN8643_c0_g1~~TRINITY_DN8643_c0_g1_i1.p1  ORF type:complete len:178 (+),score=25.58 TRINITY_DN8643_c0_g1_i1:30-563(+)